MSVVTYGLGLTISGGPTSIFQQIESIELVDPIEIELIEPIEVELVAPIEVGLVEPIEVEVS
jgi:hypothetical protein